MLYQLDISRKAQQDLDDSARYITDQLKNPWAARNLLRNAFHAIDSLEEFPARFSVVRDPFLASLGIRFVPVQNCLIEPSPRSFGDFLFSLQFNEVFALVKHFFGA